MSTNETAITTAKDFQTRMFERVREHIGELLTDDELKKIVDQAMQKAFFEERVTKDRYGDIRERAPSLFVELLTKLVEPSVNAAVREWVGKHPEEITKALDAVIAKGITGMIAKYIDEQARWPLQQLADNLRQKGVL
jgi:hypothetical protein